MGTVVTYLKIECLDCGEWKSYNGTEFCTRCKNIVKNQ